MARIEREWQAEQEGAALASELHRVMAISHRQAKGFIDGGCVTVNGEAAGKHGHRLKTGDTVKVCFDPERTYEVMPPASKLHAGPFETLWEDSHLLFVFKPAGLLTVPAEQGNEPNLAEAITESYRRRGFKRFNLYIVHRLDRFTSGVLVFAKTPEALHGLKKHFELHRLQRVYRAVLVGELPENSGTLAGHVIEHAKSLKMSVAKERKGPGGKRMPPGAKEAVTHYRVVERLPGHTVVEVRLETGRRNQIRVQFADRGFPLLGDQVYGTESPLLDRQALHAELLGFKHPVTEDQVTVTAPMPADMEAALKALRNQARLHRAAEGVKGEEGLFQPQESRDHRLKRIARAKRFDKPQEAEAPRPERRSARPGRAAEGDRLRASGAPKGTPSRFRREDEAPRPRRAGSEERPDRARGMDKERPARRRPDAAEGEPRRRVAPQEGRPRWDREESRPRRTGSEERPGRDRGMDKERPARRRPDAADGESRGRVAPQEGRSRWDREAPRPRRSGQEERPGRDRGADKERPARRKPASAEGESRGRVAPQEGRPRWDRETPRPRRSSSAPAGARRGPEDRPRPAKPRAPFTKPTRKKS